MERNATNGTKLIALVKSKTGHVISPSLLSMILRKSRRCSRINAFALHMVTGVSMDVLTRWEDDEPSRLVARFGRSAKKARGNAKETASVV